MRPASVRPRGRDPADLPSSELARVEARMRPGKASQGGFLTPLQSLISLVEEDGATLAHLGVTHERMSNRLSLLLERSFQSPGGPLGWSSLLLGRFRVHAVRYCGYQVCAFSEEHPACGSCSQEYEILNVATGESFWTTGLHPHLIGEHRFFEGGPYRLDPVRAVRVLELSPGTPDLVTKTVTVESVWLFGSCCCEWQGYLWEADDVRELMNAGRRFELAPGLDAHVSGDFGFLCAPAPVTLDGPIELDGATLSTRTFSGGQEIFRGEQTNERWDEVQIGRLEEALRVPSGRMRVPNPSHPPWRNSG